MFVKKFIGTHKTVKKPSLALSPPKIEAGKYSWLEGHVVLSQRHIIFRIECSTQNRGAR
jgi:hypothetical protein